MAKTTEKVKAEKIEKAPKAPKTKKVGYFRGAFAELKQVHFPTRKATWKMVLAVVIYVLAFTALVLLLDMLFDFIFKNLLRA